MAIVVGVRRESADRRVGEIFCGEQGLLPCFEACESMLEMSDESGLPHGNELYLRDSRDGKILDTLQLGQGKTLRQVRFCHHRSSAHLAVLTQDGEVRLWRDTKEPFNEALIAAGSSTKSIAFVPGADPPQLVTCSSGEQGQVSKVRCRSGISSRESRPCRSPHTVISEKSSLSERVKIESQCVYHKKSSSLISRTK